MRRRTGAAAIGAGYAAPPTAGSDLGAGKRGAIHWHTDRGMGVSMAGDEPDSACPLDDKGSDPSPRGKDLYRPD